MLHNPLIRLVRKVFSPLFLLGAAAAQSWALGQPASVWWVVTLILLLFYLGAWMLQVTTPHPDEGELDTAPSEEADAASP